MSAAGEIPGTCGACVFWRQLVPGDIEQRATVWGPWPEEKPAGECKRFPPTQLWGATASAQSYGIGSSIKTFHDDWCGEHKPL